MSLLLGMIRLISSHYSCDSFRCSFTSLSFLLKSKHSATNSAAKGSLDGRNSVILKLNGNYSLMDPTCSQFLPTSVSRRYLCYPNKLRGYRYGARSSGVRVRRALMVLDGSARISPSNLVSSS